MRGRRLLIATHLAQSNYLVDQQQVVGFAVPFTGLFTLCENAGSKPFCWAKPSCFDFSSSNFLCRATDSAQAELLLGDYHSLHCHLKHSNQKPIQVLTVRTPLHCTLPMHLHTTTSYPQLHMHQLCYKKMPKQILKSSTKILRNSLHNHFFCILQRDGENK